MHFGAIGLGHDLIRQDDDEGRVPDVLARLQHRMAPAEWFLLTDAEDAREIGQAVDLIIARHNPQYSTANPNIATEDPPGPPRLDQTLAHS